MPVASRPLTPKQAAFVREYLVDLNATQAAVRAGYSVRTAGSIGQENLTKPEIRQAVETALEQRAAQTARTALEVLRDIRELGREARESGDLKTALKTYELEGRHLGMFTDKTDLRMDGGVRVEHAVSPAVEAALRRLNGGNGHDPA